MRVLAREDAMRRELPRILPTTVMGSYGAPSWLWAAREKIRAGAFGGNDLEETLDDAVHMAICDQEAARVDLPTDGEMRRQDFTVQFFQRLTGVAEHPPPRQMGYPGYDMHPLYVATERIAAPNGLGIREEFRRAKTHATKALKVTCPGPLTLLPRIPPGSSHLKLLDCAYDLARIINAELQGLVEDGVRWLQVDEPALTRFTSERPSAYPTSPWFNLSVTEAVELLNATVQGVRAHITVHFCFGSYYSQHRSKRTYRPLFPAIRDLHAHALAMEFANRELAEIELAREIPEEKDVVAGLIDVKSFYVETPEDVAERVRRLLPYVPAQRLWISPDCGFRFIPRWLARAKLRSMVAGVEQVRREA